MIIFLNYLLDNKTVPMRRDDVVGTLLFIISPAFLRERGKWLGH